MNIQRSDGNRYAATLQNRLIRSSLLVSVFGTILLTTNSIRADNPGRVETANTEILTIEIETPKHGESVNVTNSSSLVVSGRVSLGAYNARPHASVVYVIDVSGSTKHSGIDCNNDDRVDAGDNFAPDDASSGTTLDCEVGAVMALNDSLGSYRSIYTAAISFATRAKTIFEFSAKPDRDENHNQIPDLDEILLQLDQGGGTFRVGGRTDFTNALSEITRLMNTRPEDDIKVAYFLTDGRSKTPVTREAIAARKAGIRIETYAIGPGTDKCENSPLQEIADLTNGTCNDVEDINELTSTLVETDNQPPFAISQVSLTINGSHFDSAVIDKFGNWSYIIGVPVLFDRANIITVTATGPDGNSAQADIQFDLNR